MSAEKNNQPKGPTPDGKGAEGEKKKRPETIADFMALDTVVGAVSSSEHVPGGASMSVDSSEKFADGLVKQYRRQQAEFAKYLREKEQNQQ